MTKKQDAKAEAKAEKAEAKTDHDLLMAVAHACRVHPDVKAMLQEREQAEADKDHKDK